MYFPFIIYIFPFFNSSISTPNGGEACFWNLGPLHTWAKSRDHEIVRAQKKVSKSCPNTSLTSYSVVMDQFSSVVWSHMWLGPQPNAISIYFYSCGLSHTIKENKSAVVSIWSAMVFRFCGRPISKRWFFKIIQVTMKHDALDAM
jgi:hypothetical protein